MNGFLAILLKEFAHIRRDRSTLFFVLVVPAVQMIVFGYAIDTTIENIPLVVFDLDGRTESRRLIDSLVATRTFVVVEQVHDADSFRRSLTSGRAKTGLIIPASYSEDLLRGRQAAVQVLIDGSDSQVATAASNTVTMLVTNLSLGRGKALGESLQVAVARNAGGSAAMPIEARVRLLYNPDLESAHFFVPGLVAIILQLVLVFLTSFSIVKEREVGTLEQLFVTPVGRAGLMFGKLTPYALLAFGELLIILLMMTTVFSVPVNGSLMLLLALSWFFIVTVLGLGLLVSTVAATQLQAMQFSFLIMLPSVLLSGFMFPREQMPFLIYLPSNLLPVTWYIQILRGVILRGADFHDLIRPTIALCLCGAVILSISLARFRKQLD